MPIDPSLLSRDIELIKKRRGIDAIHMGNETTPMERISLPYPTLMRITSGGIPIGALTRLWGGTNSGKTQILYDIIAAAQKHKSKRFPKGLSCAYWNIEQQYDEIYAKYRGIDVEKLVLQEALIVEDIAQELEILLSSVHLHGIDSASFATSQDELAAKPGDWLPGIHARAWKKAINRIHTRIDRDENVVIIIDHEAVDWQGHTAPQGPRKMEYRSDLSIQMSRGAWLFYDDHGELVTNDKLKERSKYGIGAAGLKEADGVEVSVRIPKSRVCRPLRSGKMRLDLHTMRFDAAFELAEHAKFLDFDGLPAHRTGKPPMAIYGGGWYRIPEKKDGEWVIVPGKNGRQGHGFRGLRKEIRDDPELQAMILGVMLKEDLT